MICLDRLGLKNAAPFGKNSLRCTELFVIITHFCRRTMKSSVFIQKIFENVIIPMLQQTIRCGGDLISRASRASFPKGEALRRYGKVSRNANAFPFGEGGCERSEQTDEVPRKNSPYLLTKRDNHF